MFDLITLRKRAEKFAEIGDNQSALDTYREISNTGCSEYWVYLGAIRALHHLGAHIEARAVLDAAIKKFPLNGALAFQSGSMLLLEGDYKAGWEAYECRRLQPGWNARGYSFPNWRGEDLRGKSILIYGEQGYGDEIMFASLYREIISRADYVAIETSHELAPIFKRSFRSAFVFERSPDRNPLIGLRGKHLDYQVACASLPFYLGMREPAQTLGYIAPDDELLKRSLSILQSLPAGLRVGLSWEGGLPETRKFERSIPLINFLMALRIPGIQFVSLQYSDINGERAKAFAREYKVPLHSLPTVTRNLDFTAAMICALDCVISVCNTNVHLAGALNRPCYCLTPYVPEWRYGMSGNMPWYRSVRLYRQQKYADWRGPIGQVADMLRGMVGLLTDQ